MSLIPIRPVSVNLNLKCPYLSNFSVLSLMNGESVLTLSFWRSRCEDGRQCAELAARFGQNLCEEDSTKFF